MWASGIVMANPRLQEGPQMGFSQGNQPIEALAASAPDEPFANRVGRRTSRRRFQYFDPEFHDRLVEGLRASPHDGFSFDIRRIKACTSTGIDGRPGRDFKRHHSFHPARCHRFIVSGAPPPERPASERFLKGTPARHVSPNRSAAAQHLARRTVRAVGAETDSAPRSIVVTAAPSHTNEPRRRPTEPR